MNDPYINEDFEEEHRTFLFPVMIRRGQLVLPYVVVEDKNFMFGIYHQFNSESCDGKLATGYGNNYDACSRMPISKEFYDAFVAESERNHEKFKPKQ